MALSSMWASAWASAIRPLSVCSERLGTRFGSTSSGRAGRPGLSGGVPSIGLITEIVRSNQRRATIRTIAVLRSRSLCAIASMQPPRRLRGR